MPTVTLVQMLAAGVVDSAGDPIASGRVRFYVPTTLTPITVYDASDGLTPIAPPLILTAGGTGTAYVTTATRIIIKDATDTNTMFDGVVDQISGGAIKVTSTSFSFTDLNTVLDGWTTSAAATNWQASTGKTGATARNLSAWVQDLGQSVVGYGAVGDGATDDKTAFDRAIAAAATGKVYLPPGQYRVSGALAISSPIELVGAGAGTTSIILAGATNLFTISGASGSLALSHLTLAHATTTTAAAVSTSSTSTVPLKLTDVAITAGDFRTAIQSTGSAPIVAVDSVLAANSSDTSSIGVALATTATTFTATGTSISAYLYGILASTASKVRMTGGSVTASNGDAVVNNVGGAGSDVYLDGVRLSGGGTYALDLASGVELAEYTTTTVTAGAIRDARAGAPVAYSFGTSSAVTPLPMQSEQIRVIATAAITVTVNAISTTGWARPWRLYCINNSGGAVTWTFNAQYKTSAAVAPATGNMIIVTFEYDPVSSVVREVARSGTIAI